MSGLSEHKTVHTRLSRASICFRICWYHMITIESYFFLPRYSDVQHPLLLELQKGICQGIWMQHTYCTDTVNKFMITRSSEILDKVLPPFELVLILATYHFLCFLFDDPSDILVKAFYLMMPSHTDPLINIFSVRDYQLSSYCVYKLRACSQAINSVPWKGCFALLCRLF